MAKKGSFFSSLFGRKKHDEQKPDPIVSETPLADAEKPLADTKEPLADTKEPSAPSKEPSAPKKELPSAVDDAATAMQESAAGVKTDYRQEQSAEVVTTAANEPVDVEIEVEPAMATEHAAERSSATEATSAPASEPTATAERPAKKSWWQRLREGLQKTSSSLGSGLANLFVGKKIDDELFEDLETHLLMADVGVATTRKIIDDLTDHASRQELKDAELLYSKLKEDMAALLAPVSQPLSMENSEGPFVILMVGVNGVGKTTTIGKLARQFQNEGKSVMLAAGDTFRAAAVEQLQVWGERNQIPVVAQHTGADSASVIFDAVQAAKARKVDVLIADTAGRLQNKAHLMEELKKITRVMKKLDVQMPHEVLLTLDAGTGQNAISQAKLFNEAVGVTGLVMTKLDGTAKGGVIFALADQFKIPIRYIGVGESLEDLRPFVATEFVDALFNQNEKGADA
ncbi:MAG: signal recognition particle-docking protein FtsY [Aliidiomarina sp.]|uniref:signal recognition particle-docking protein FtsY n=1 Tax=Aliidiomarina sp. TaxID=1872439 RepID=UPI0025C10CBE|nr:signal recognition particle-docking protein FtsY [Aliidiomarina sp.]MCH8501628.1 signal recognition particle-docking protein FtsY [Aliidiomarina sp.]